MKAGKAGRAPINALIAKKQRHFSWLRERDRKFFPDLVPVFHQGKIMIIGTLLKYKRIDQSDISKIERGVANPSVTTLDRIAAALGGHLSITIEMPSSSG